MTRLLAAASIAALLCGPALGQGFQLQGLPNGVPGAPEVSGADTTSGLYFGAGRTGISKHLESGAGATVPAPVLSACGGTTAGDTGSTDTAGTAAQGGTVTTCTVTFGTAFTAAPTCMVTDLTGTRASMAAAVTASAITITGITAADKIGWFCIAKSGG